jgi:hypothetical protein
MRSHPSCPRRGLRYPKNYAIQIYSIPANSDSGWSATGYRDRATVAGFGDAGVQVAHGWLVTGVLLRHCSGNPRFLTDAGQRLGDW